MNLKIFASHIDEATKEQISNLSNHRVYKNMKIRVMPDCHAGKGCTVGTTIDLGKYNYVTPNLVGVDIGCAVLTLKLKSKIVDLDRFDKVIHEFVPAGFNIRKTPHEFVDMFNVKELLGDLVCKDKINIDRALLSIGTLGGGEMIASFYRNVSK